MFQPLLTDTSTSGNGQRPSPHQKPLPAQADPEEDLGARPSLARECHGSGRLPLVPVPETSGCLILTGVPGEGRAAWAPAGPAGRALPATGLPQRLPPRGQPHGREAFGRGPNTFQGCSLFCSCFPFSPKLRACYFGDITVTSKSKRWKHISTETLQKRSTDGMLPVTSRVTPTNFKRKLPAGKPVTLLGNSRGGGHPAEAQDRRPAASTNPPSHGNSAVNGSKMK